MKIGILVYDHHVSLQFQTMVTHICCYAYQASVPEACGAIKYWCQLQSRQHSTILRLTLRRIGFINSLPKRLLKEWAFDFLFATLPLTTLWLQSAEIPSPRSSRKGKIQKPWLISRKGKYQKPWLIYLQVTSPSTSNLLTSRIVLSLRNEAGRFYSRQCNADTVSQVLRTCL